MINDVLMYELSWDPGDGRDGRWTSDETEIRARFHVDAHCSAFVLARIRLQ